MKNVGDLKHTISSNFTHKDEHLDEFCSWFYMWFKDTKKKETTGLGCSIMNDDLERYSIPYRCKISVCCCLFCQEQLVRENTHIIKKYNIHMLVMYIFYIFWYVHL